MNRASNQGGVTNLKIIQKGQILLTLSYMELFSALWARRDIAHQIMKLTNGALFLPNFGNLNSVVMELSVLKILQDFVNVLKKEGLTDKINNVAKAAQSLTEAPSSIQL